MASSAVETVVTPSTKVKGHVARPARDSIQLLTLEHNDGPSAAQIDNDVPQYNSSPEKGLFTKTNLHFATLCWCLFLAGWNDGTIGPLLPRVQGVYDVNFTIVSLIFIFNTVGFVAASIANVLLTDYFGFGVVMVIGSLIQSTGYVLSAIAPPFPVFVLAYFLSGFGIALQDAGCSGYIAAMNDSTRMGIMHAIYGSGTFASPLVSTQFAQLPRWSFHYLVSFGMSLVNIAMLSTVFRFRSQEKCLEEIGHTIPPAPIANSSGSKYKQIFKRKDVHLLAFFILVGVGVASTIGSWIVTYIIDVRGGNSSSGYINSGLGAGITLGRVALLWFNKKIGERRVIFIYNILVIGLLMVVWFVPSLIGNAIAISFVGFFLGPLYPIVMNHAGRIIPAWILTGCIAWIAGFGQAGSALVPFIMGVLASNTGIRSLQPFIVSLSTFMLFLWILVPNARRPD